MTKKVSAKSVIEAGIAGGKSAKVILGQLAKKCPDSKADESHIRFYANAAIRGGLLSAEDGAKLYGCGSRGRKPAAEKTAKVAKAKVAKAKKGAKTETTAVEKPKRARKSKAADDAPAKTKRAKKKAPVES